MIEQKLISTNMDVILNLIHFHELKNTISVKLNLIISKLLESTH